jgi:hypothetical protein
VNDGEWNGTSTPRRRRWNKERGMTKERNSSVPFAPSSVCGAKIAKSVSSFNVFSLHHHDDKDGENSSPPADRSSALDLYYEWHCSILSV